MKDEVAVAFYKLQSGNSKVLRMIPNILGANSLAWANSGDVTGIDHYDKRVRYIYRYH